MTPGVAYAVAVIVNARDEVLLLRRAVESALGGGKWGLCGGRLEPREDPRAGMERELREELGPDLQARCEAIVGPIPAVGLPDAVIILFRYRYLGGSIALNAEHTRFAWVDEAAFGALDVMDGVKADLDYFGLWRG